MPEQNPNAPALTLEQAHAELAQLAQWWEQYQQMMQQAPQVQQRVAFLQGCLQPPLPSAESNGHAPVEVVADPAAPNRQTRRAASK